MLSGGAFTEPGHGSDITSLETTAVRQGDDQWFNIVRWTLFALIEGTVKYERDLTALPHRLVHRLKRGAEVPIPVDVVTAKTFAADAPATIKAATDVADDDLILDIGPETAALLAEQLKAAGTIVWNGPVGVFEFDAFAQGTETVARAIAASPAFSIAGGGDTHGLRGNIGRVPQGTAPGGGSTSQHLTRP